MAAAADPVSLVRDHKVKGVLAQVGVQTHSFNADLLFEPWEIFDHNGCAFTTFDAYWKCCLAMPRGPDTPLPAPKTLLPPAGRNKQPPLWFAASLLVLATLLVGAPRTLPAAPSHSRAPGRSVR